MRKKAVSKFGKYEGEFSNENLNERIRQSSPYDKKHKPIRFCFGEFFCVNLSCVIVMTRGWGRGLGFSASVLECRCAVSLFGANCAIVRCSPTRGSRPGPVPPCFSFR